MRASVLSLCCGLIGAAPIACNKTNGNPTGSQVSAATQSARNGGTVNPTGAAKQRTTKQAGAEALGASDTKPASAGQRVADTGGRLIQLETSAGNITIALDPDKAPQTVANFLRYVRSGFYSGTIFHRVIQNFMIQGGGFDASYHRKPTRGAIQNEADNRLSNARGTVAMARTSDPHSASAQFFINLKDNRFLDHTGKTAEGWGYCVFGRVTAGMEVVDKIAAGRTGARGPFGKDAPLEQVVITAASVVK